MVNSHYASLFVVAESQVLDGVSAGDGGISDIDFFLTIDNIDHFLILINMAHSSYPIIISIEGSAEINHSKATLGLICKIFEAQNTNIDTLSVRNVDREVMYSRIIKFVKSIGSQICEKYRLYHPYLSWIGHLRRPLQDIHFFRNQ